MSIAVAGEQDPVAIVLQLDIVTVYASEVTLATGVYSAIRCHRLYDDERPDVLCTNAS